MYHIDKTQDKKKGGVNGSFSRVSFTTTKKSTTKLDRDEQKFNSIMDIR